MSEGREDMFGSDFLTPNETNVYGPVLGGDNTSPIGNNISPIQSTRRTSGIDQSAILPRASYSAASQSYISPYDFCEGYQQQVQSNQTQSYLNPCHNSPAALSSMPYGRHSLLKPAHLGSRGTHICQAGGYLPPRCQQSSSSQMQYSNVPYEPFDPTTLLVQDFNLSSQFTHLNRSDCQQYYNNFQFQQPASPIFIPPTDQTFEGNSSDLDTENDYNMDDDKPYAQYIYDALSHAPDHRMLLRDIYKWFEDNTNKPRNAESNGWQNSIRHNLSMNQAFENDKTEPMFARGSRKANSVWMLTADAIRNGVQSTTRYRKHGARKVGKGHRPDVRRQRSGARGGRAAKCAAQRRQLEYRRREEQQLRAAYNYQLEYPMTPTTTPTAIPLTTPTIGGAGANTPPLSSTPNAWSPTTQDSFSIIDEDIGFVDAHWSYAEIPRSTYQRASLVKEQQEETIDFNKSFVDDSAWERLLSYAPVGADQGESGFVVPLDN